MLRTAFGMAPPPDAKLLEVVSKKYFLYFFDTKHLRAFYFAIRGVFGENKIKTAENGVRFYLYKFALQTFLSSVVSHFVAKQLKKSILKLKF